MDKPTMETIANLYMALGTTLGVMVQLQGAVGALVQGKSKEAREAFLRSTEKGQELATQIEQLGNQISAIVKDA